MSEQISMVMVAVDSSEEAAAATHHAALLASLLDATLQLIHVLPLNPAELSDVPSNREISADHDRAQQSAKANAVFQAAHQQLTALPFTASLTVEEVRLHDKGFVSQPERIIVEHARQHSKTLLVMGARHLSEVGKWLRGSVSNAVVHRARGPVTIIHADANIIESAKIGRILLPVDGSSHSDAAAQLAGDLARSGHIGVEMLFCQPPASQPSLNSGESEEQRVFRHTREMLGEVPAGVTEQLLQAERYAEAIIEQAEKCPDSPVIIMGRRGLGYLQESLLGSVSQKVIELAPCPVTVVA